MKKANLSLAVLAAGAASALSLWAQPVLADPAGQPLFAKKCSACHQVTGKGIPGAFPALAGDKFVLTPNDEPIVRTVLKGRGGMPSFSSSLDDATIADILTYVRSAWGNKAAPVKPETVAKVRADIGKSTVHNINN